MHLQKSGEGTMKDFYFNRQSVSDLRENNILSMTWPGKLGKMHG